MLPHCFTTEDLTDPDYNETVLQKRVKHLEIILKHCWCRWRTEYLSALRESHISDRGLHGQNSNNIQVGDIVLVHSDTEKRVHWPLAIVTKLNKGNDGLVRSAIIRTKNGVSSRPIVKLYPLEIRTSTNEQNTESNENNDCVSTPVNSRNRMTRTAAEKARAQIKIWTKELMNN